MANNKFKNMSSNDRLNRIDELGEQADELQKKNLALQRTQTKKSEKLKEQQFEEKIKLEDQQAHGSLGDTVEDLGIQAGQALGLSPNTTTDYVMGAQDAVVNLFSSNEAIVEYYKNYDANRAKEEQKVNAVYSRELSQDQQKENMKLSEKQSAQTYKENKKSTYNAIAQNKVNRVQQAALRSQKAMNELGVIDALSGTFGDMFTID